LDGKDSLASPRHDPGSEEELFEVPDPRLRVKRESEMRWYEEFQARPRLGGEKSKFAALVSVDSGPTRSEKERARVLEISRGKIKNSQESSQHKPEKNKRCDDAFIATDVVVDSTLPKRSRRWPRDSVSLREVVAVKNTVRKLEREVRAEIMAVFDLPASMG